MFAVVLLIALVVFALLFYVTCKATHWEGLPESAGREPRVGRVAAYRFCSIGVSRDRGTEVWLRGTVKIALDDQGLFLRPGFLLRILMRPVCLAWKFIDSFEDGTLMGVRRVVVHALGDRYRITLLGAAAASFADRANAQGLPPYQPKVWERSAKRG